MFFMSFFIGPFLIILGEVMFGEGIFWVILLGFILFIPLVLIFAEVFARLSYNNWAYELTPGNLKVERGIIWKRYSNVPYERVQNVDIHRGIIARMFGFSSVNVQTAGFSGQQAMAEGYIPGVSIKKAEEMREFLMSKISKRHGQGL